jgi:hypothetical protein
MAHDRIGLLFLVIDGLAHPGLWRRFLNGHEGRFAAYTHAKFPHRVGPHFLRDTLIPEYVATHRSTYYPHHVLIQAQLALLRHALADKRIRKLVYITQTCVPICRFQEAYEALLADDQSWITCNGGLVRPQRYASLPPASGIRPEEFGDSSCWVALSRCHGKILLDAEREWLPKFVGVPAAEEHFAPTVLKMAGCADQCRPYNPTRVDWTRGCPYAYEHVSAADVQQLSEGPYLFARKFPPNSDIAAVWDEILRRRAWPGSREVLP